MIVVFNIIFVIILLLKYKFIIYNMNNNNINNNNINNNNINNNYMNENRRNNIMNNLREIINGYNNTNQLYNLNMYDYNRNISSLIRLLEQMNTTNRSTRFSSSFRDPLYSRRNSLLDDEYYNSILFRLTTQLNNSLNSPTSNGLTETQLQQHTQIIQYSSSLSEPRCYITHDQFVENEDVCQIISCGHYFKPNAIKRWLENNTTCPVCRLDLTNQPTANSNNRDVSNNDLSGNNTNSYDDLPPLTDNSSSNDNNIYTFTNVPLNTQSMQQISSIFNNIDPSNNNLSYTFDFPLYFPPPNNNNESN